MNPAITKIIDQYLAGELSAEDTQAFEAKLASNPELQREVQLQQDVMDGAKRAAQRTEIKKVSKRYHFSQLLKWAAIGLSSIALVATVVGVLTTTNTGEPIEESLLTVLDKDAQFDNLPAQYFQIPENGGFVLSEQGVLISVPENAFLQNGQPYVGESVIQFQEAMRAEDIVMSGLSTMSGDRLLETQGMFGLRAYTKDGVELEVNPEVGVYLQAPVDENKTGMQLFEGEKDANGTIDWQNPQPLLKIPVPVDMAELDFYPEKYEPYLDELKWKTSKKSRDSLYLSFEEYCNENNQEAIYSIEAIVEVPDTSYYLYNLDSIENYVADEATVGVAQVAPPYILPSNVLGFWDRKFNNTNLSTRAFEQRMRAIHGTCNNDVLDKYTGQLNKALSEIDREVVAMGYGEFERFAAENLGKVDMSNAHLKNLQTFYAKAVKQLKQNNKRIQDKEQKRQNDWNQDLQKERNEERTRSINRENQALQEEYAFNMRNVKRQIGPTVGLTITHGGGTVYNIDKYVWDATVNRESMDRIDPISGKRVKITYNDFSFEVPDHDQYIQLFAYVFPSELNSYQRLEGKNGKFDYPLNDDIIYDIGVVGTTESGYAYYQKLSFKKGELGIIQLERVSESEMKESIRLLNSKRISKPMRIQEELEWLIKEREDFTEQKLRKEMRLFREELSSRIFPCRLTEQADYQSQSQN